MATSNNTPQQPLAPTGADATEAENDEWKRFKKLTFWVTGAVLLVVVILFLIVQYITNAWIATAISGYALWEFLRRGWEEFSFDPPTKWIPLIREKPVNVLRKWGWYFFPLKNKFMLYYQKVPGTELALRFTVSMRTPQDSAEMRIPFFIFLVVDEKNPAQFFIAGGLEGVLSKIKDLIEEALREWITSPDKGPQTWREARQAILETLNIVLETLFTRDVGRIDPKVPTEVLIRFFAHRLTEKEQNEWGAYLNRLQQDQARQEDLQNEVNDRKRLIQDAKIGKIRYGVTSLGVIVTRIGLSNIEPDGETAVGVNGVIKATLDAEAENIYSENFRVNVQKLTPIMGDDPKEARKAQSVLQGKTKEDIKEIHISSDPTTLGGIGDILQRLFRR